jgi:hypothetical protein
MKNLDVIAKDLFNKIRGRFPNITIGDSEGNVTNIPDNARYFDFAFSDEKEKKISVSLDENNGVVVIVGKDIVSNQPEHVQDRWYNFLKELRIFAKKRLLNFDVRDINKSNLNKRDYKFLAATRPGDEPMAESRMYGTNKTSYQRIGNARLAIKHSQPINVESTGSRSQKIKAIYIESPEGERFKYPFKHIAGARAMARHVSEGGNAYDDFGKYVAGLSEEAVKLQKFKTYMGRSTVMAETLAGYMDTVNERIQAVKKEITRLQKESFYKEAVTNFTVSVVEDVPEDVAENWIDQLTIKQFNEELKDVFPYIYKLVGEATKAKELGPEDLIDESGLQYYTGVKKHGKEYMKKAAQAGREGASQEELGRLKDKYSKAEKKTKEEFELEQAFEDTMGQFSDHVCEDCGNPSWRTLSEEKQKGVDGKVCWKGYKRMGTKMKGGKRVDNCVKVSEAVDDIEEGIKSKLAMLALLGLTGYGAMKATSPVNSPLGQALQQAAQQGDEDAAYHLSKLGAYVDAGDSQTLKQLNFQYLDEPAAMKDDATVHESGQEILKQLVPMITAQGKRWNQFVGSGYAWPIDPQEYIRISQLVANQKNPSAILNKEKERLNKLQNFIKQHSQDPKSHLRRNLQPLLQNPNILQVLQKISSMLDQLGGNNTTSEYSPPNDSVSSPLSMSPKKSQTPLGEFILSYFDRETGKFPKGETAVLTAVQKDYGDQYVKPAVEFIKKVEAVSTKNKMEKIQSSPHPETEMIKHLAGV